MVNVGMRGYVGTRSGGCDGRVQSPARVVGSCGRGYSCIRVGGYM